MQEHLAFNRREIQLHSRGRIWNLRRLVIVLTMSFEFLEWWKSTIQFCSGKFNADQMEHKNLTIP
ncbi:hypothetical protein CU097_010430 [Rhizopus azygosporus]|uniref:Uncharacterized protein n=1 Tax=Rhizopus azygosporus TaxID=86630 RepID=A0A367KDK8_RHIAZ|nr:hypothetical protein CU097_010430 [Rhizopus azygosporus]